MTGSEKADFQNALCMNCWHDRRYWRKDGQHAENSCPLMQEVVFESTDTPESLHGRFFERSVIPSEGGAETKYTCSMFVPMLDERVTRLSKPQRITPNRITADGFWLGTP